MMKSTKPKIKMRGVTKMEFSESGRSVILDGERLNGADGPSIYYGFERNHKWSGPQGVSVTLEEKAKIKRFIEAEMKRFGTEVDVEID